MAGPRWNSLCSIRLQSKFGCLWSFGPQENTHQSSWVNTFNSIFQHSFSPITANSFIRLCTGFGWDFEGSNLGIIAENSSVLIIWNSKNLKIHKVETGLKEMLTFLAWGKSGVFLAIGTAKGNVLLYNQKAGRKVPILGKHSKKITCGAWSSDNLLALGSEDRTLSVSTFEGDMVHSANLRSEPSQIQFSEMKLDERSTAESTVKNYILLFSFKEFTYF